MEKENLVYKPRPGAGILGTFARAAMMARKSKSTVCVVMNDIEMNVTPDALPVQVSAAYLEKLKEQGEAEIRANLARKNARRRKQNEGR